MKTKWYFVFLTLVFAVLILGFLAGKAAAATGCFSDTISHWAEAYICWLKDNGISTGYPDGTFKPENAITRAEMAVMLKRANAVPPQNGLILFSVAHTNWVTLGTNNTISATYEIGKTEFRSSSPAYRYLMVNPDFTPVLYGKSLQLAGVEFCYANNNTTINRVVVGTNIASIGMGAPVFNYAEDISYTDSACRYFTVAEPFTLTAEAGVFFSVGVDFIDTTSVFMISRTTFVFQPTATTAAVPASMSTGETILTESRASPVPGSP